MVGSIRVLFHSSLPNSSILCICCKLPEEFRFVLFNTLIFPICRLNFFVFLLLVWRFRRPGMHERVFSCHRNMISSVVYVFLLLFSFLVCWCDFLASSCSMIFSSFLLSWVLKFPDFSKVFFCIFDMSTLGVSRCSLRYQLVRYRICNFVLSIIFLDLVECLNLFVRQCLVLS